MPVLTGRFAAAHSHELDVDWDFRDQTLAMSQRGTPLWTDNSSRVLTRSAAGLAIAWDGRLDNRDDLLLRLGIHGDPADAELAMEVFERWSVSGLEHLVGDWSLALWDSAGRRLHLARDYMGARPLYFRQDAEGLRWSSDLAELVTRCACADALSDTFAASFMSVRSLQPLTPYQDVHVVPAGTCLTVSCGAVINAQRLWHLRAEEIRYRRSTRYEEELRTLWTRAVGARLRCPGIVWAELSGGLDSSSITCMADHLIRRCRVPARALRPISHATLQSPEGDERRFIAEVERRIGVCSEIVGVEENRSQSDPERAWLTPYVLQGVGLATVRRVRERGGRLVLSGRVGDAVMGCQPDNSEAVFEHLARAEYLGAARRLRSWSRATRKPIIEIAWRLFSPAADPTDTGPDLLTPRLRGLLSDLETIDAAPEISRSRRTLARLILSYARGGRLDIPDLPPEITYAFPFADRPLVEFVLAIPGEELSAPGVTRALMRRAFAGLLPPRILARTSKGYYPPDALRAARRHAASILDARDLEVVKRNWIDADRLQRALQTFVHGASESGADIHRVLRLERWLQARAEHRPTRARKEVNSHALLST